MGIIGGIRMKDVWKISVELNQKTINNFKPFLGLKFHICIKSWANHETVK